MIMLTSITAVTTGPLLQLLLPLSPAVRPNTTIPIFFCSTTQSFDNYSGIKTQQLLQLPLATLQQLTLHLEYYTGQGNTGVQRLCCLCTPYQKPPQDAELKLRLFNKNIGNNTLYNAGDTSMRQATTGDNPYDQSRRHATVICKVVYTGGD